MVLRCFGGFPISESGGGDEAHVAEIEPEELQIESIESRRSLEPNQAPKKAPKSTIKRLESLELTQGHLQKLGMV